MNREPIGLYIFRFVVGFGIFAFMMMLYWSSQILEGEVQEIKNDQKDTKNEALAMRLEMQKLREDVLKEIREGQPNTEGPKIARDTNPLFRDRSQIDSSLPNLLAEDLYYGKVLPKQLGADFKPWGVRHTAIMGKPDNLHPFSGWATVSALIDQCSVAVATNEFGKYETLSPNMAIKMEMRKVKVGDDEVPEFWIHLRDGVYWQPLQQAHFPDSVVLAPSFLDKHQVTAQDFKFFLDALMNPFVQEPGAVAMRNYLEDIEEIRVIDDLTFAVRWKTENRLDETGKLVPKIKYIAKGLTGSLKPLPSFVYQYFADGRKIIDNDSDPNTYRTDSVWAQNFTQHWAKNIIVSCGAWTFDGMSDQLIKFKRNPEFYKPYAVLVERMEMTIKDSPDALWQDFKAGKQDMHQLRPEQLVDLDQFLKADQYKAQEQSDGMQINRLDYVDDMFAYIGWNEATPFFSSKKVRQAMTLAIDRNRIIQQNLNGMGTEITAPMRPSSPGYDTTIHSWPFDPQAAKRLLEQEGWYDSEGDGIIDKEINGVRVPFRFTLTYYVKGTTGKAVCEYVVSALREVGIDCQLNGVDVPDLTSAFEDKSFQAISLAWSMGSPPEDLKQLWDSSGAKLKGSSNMIGFANAEVDKIIDQLQYEYDQKERIKLYHRFHAIMHEEAPYVFLFVPKAILLYRNYVQNVFIPADRQDLIPGANIDQPDFSVVWLKKEG